MNHAKAPKILVWEKKNEGCVKGCTSKGNHGSKVASFLLLHLSKGFDIAALK